MEMLEGFDEKPKRPQFLTVLCILSFVGGSFFIIRNAVLYARAGDIASIISTAKKNVEQDSARGIDSVKRPRSKEDRKVFGNFMNSFSDMTTKKGLQENAMATIISSVITLLGALLMWRLKKIGFYIYILGTIVGLAAPVIFFGATSNAFAAGIFSQFFGVVFIFLYALNYRSLH
jgi:hypothetical protein